MPEGRLVWVGVRTGRALGWESWEWVVKGPVPLLWWGWGLGESSLPLEGLIRIDCSRGGGTGVQQGWRQGVLLRGKT